MRRIVDANCFHDPCLRDYLGSSRESIAVLCEPSALELYKPRSAPRLVELTRIMSAHPRQVVILRATEDIIRIQERTPQAKAEAFIDPRQTAGFADFCVAVGKAVAGDLEVCAQIEHFGRDAMQYFENVL